MNRLILILFSAVLSSSLLLADVCLSPVDVVYDGDQFLYIADHTANQIQQYNLSTDTVSNTYAINQSPNGLVMLPGDTGTLYIAAGSINGAVLRLNVTTGQIENEVVIGHTPMSPVINGQTMYVCSRFDDIVVEIDLATHTITREIQMVREPVSMEITPDGSQLVVGNHLPSGPANINDISSEVSIVDLGTYAVTNIPLYNGSTGLRGLCISPDSQYAYASHVIGRYQMPTTQLDRGWIMTNAFSIIDIAGQNLQNTILLDDVYLGAANPWAIDCSAEGQYLCVTHAGNHEMSIIDRGGLHLKLDNLAAGTAPVGGFSEVSEDVPMDMGFLAGLRKRVPLGGLGPRSMAIVGSQCYVPEYYSDTLSTVNLTEAKPQFVSVPLGPTPQMDLERRGEFFFNDASQTFQKWLSCASCHPDGRSDSLNWDLGNDGLGSPRNAKSLLMAHYAPPTTITGCRPDAYASVRAGFKFIEFVDRPEEDNQAVDEYLLNQEPLTSPYMASGTLSVSAWQGKYLFYQSGCASCHSGTYFTDMKKYDVGTGRFAGELLDTPTLIEAWRTAPYLQDGRAATIMEVLTTYNPGNQHGLTSHLTQHQLECLEEYVLSLSVRSRKSDIDDDGEINVDDLGLLVASWLEADCGLCDFADLDGDFKVDLYDYSVFSRDWLE